MGMRLSHKMAGAGKDLKDHQGPLSCPQMAMADSVQSHPSLIFPVPAAQALDKARVAEGWSHCEPHEWAVMRETWCEIKEKGYFSLDLFPKRSMALKHYRSSVFRVGRGSRSNRSLRWQRCCWWKIQFWSIPLQSPAAALPDEQTPPGLPSYLSSTLPTHIFTCQPSETKTSQNYF